MLYDPNKSKTANNQNADFQVAYGTGESRGEYWSDIFAVGLDLNTHTHVVDCSLELQMALN